MFIDTPAIHLPMSHFLLDIWREVCRHIEISAAVERIAPLLQKEMPLELLAIRAIDTEKLVVETLAYHRAAENEPHLAWPLKRESSAEEIALTLEWCRQGRVLHGNARQLDRAVQPFLPIDCIGSVWIAPLRTEHQLSGMVAAQLADGAPLNRKQQSLCESLIEPLTVALENDHRLRELTALREKAEAENRTLLSKLGRSNLNDTIVGANAGLRPVMDRIQLISKADIPVLILGETGSGKEVVARAIHQQSRRAEGPFLRVNCGAIPPELVDSELFGHERGSFTGATGLRKGWFERADRGTLFLDECGELTPAAQVRLLRILQDGTYERVGGERQMHVDVRVVAATHRDLRTMVAQGTFREDLWYRLAIFPIDLPPLRERPQDIAALAEHFAHKAATRFGLPSCSPTPEDIEILAGYSWPGNVRELAAVIERAALLGSGAFLDVTTALGVGVHSPRHSTQPAPQAANHAAAPANIVSLDEAMRRHIQTALAATNGRIEGAQGTAQLLGINPHTLRARMRKLDIEWRRYRTAGRLPLSPIFIDDGEQD